MNAALDTVQTITMVVMVGFSSPMTGEFQPNSYSFYQATVEECAAEKRLNTLENRRIVCLDGRGGESALGAFGEDSVGQSPRRHRPSPAIESGRI